MRSNTCTADVVLHQRTVTLWKLVWRIELLEDSFPKKAAKACRRSSSSILLLCWKEIFPNEHAMRFDLVEELYMLPQKPPLKVKHFAVWLEIHDEVCCRK